ncbi:hypothetical protein GCM10023238_22330 [Streptomyces heliomycini]
MSLLTPGVGSRLYGRGQQAAGLALDSLAAHHHPPSLLVCDEVVGSFGTGVRSPSTRPTDARRCRRTPRNPTPGTTQGDTPPCRMSRSTCRSRPRRAEAWTAVTRLEDYAAYMENVESVTVIGETDTGARTSEGSVLLKGSVLEWIEADTLDHDARVMSFDRSPGTSTSSTGTGSVEDTGDGTSSSPSSSTSR